MTSGNAPKEPESECEKPHEERDVLHSGEKQDEHPGYTVNTEKGPLKTTTPESGEKTARPGGRPRK